MEVFENRKKIPGKKLTDINNSNDKNNNSNNNVRDLMEFLSRSLTLIMS